MELTTVKIAEDIIQRQQRDFGQESVRTIHALGRTLAEDILADRDLPPFNRVTMDGIAICLESTTNLNAPFTIIATQAAGVAAYTIQEVNQCIEVMTGAVFPIGADTIVPYEWLDIDGSTARILTPEKVDKGQHIHRKGKDALQGAVLVKRDTPITTSVTQVLAAVGKEQVLVHRLPSVILLSTGDELLDIADTPLDYQIRRSSNYALVAQLQQYGITAAQQHVVDEPSVILQTITDALAAYDMILITGGVSKGKFDYIPSALEKAGVVNHFHGVRQRPGKPFWFGTHPLGSLVFAFPGNPVSTQLCVQRYLFPWIQHHVSRKPIVLRYAKLREDFYFEPALSYFLQVKLDHDDQGQVWASPCSGNGSGDFANLIHADAFLELPASQTYFQAGEAFPYWAIHS